MRAATSRVRAALGIAPLALISAAATVQLGQAGTVTTATVASPAHTPAPSTPSPLVRQPLAPASVVGAPLAASAAPRSALAVSAAPADAADIPYAALSAYQRAATVVGAADPTCHLDWTLLAGIGQIASQHGSLPEPASTGAADTDAGQYDGDAAHDHAIGPLRLLPATWAAIGVDGDGDGQRDPRDVDDAALAAAVFLCAGEADLAAPDAQRAAVTTYDATPGFADAVLAAAAAYRVAPPVTTVAPTTVLVRGVTFTPATVPAAAAAPEGEQAAATKPGKKPKGGKHAAAPLEPVPPSSPGVVKPANDGPAVTPPPAPTTEPKPDPTQEPTPEPTAEQLCTEHLAEKLPEADEEALAKANDLCVEELTARPLPWTDAVLDEVVAKVAEQVEGLVPPESEDTEDDAEVPDPADPSTSPAQDPTEAPSESAPAN